MTGARDADALQFKCRSRTHFWTHGAQAGDPCACGKRTLLDTGDADALGGTPQEQARQWIDAAVAEHGGDEVFLGAGYAFDDVLLDKLTALFAAEQQLAALLASEQAWKRKCDEAAIVIGHYDKEQEALIGERDARLPTPDQPNAVADTGT